MPDPLSTNCFACGYDMHDRAHGDLCPECGVPFDSRPDWPRARRDSLTIFWCGVASIVMTTSIVLMPLSTFPACIVFITLSGTGPKPRTHRISPRWMRLRRTGKVLAWISLGITVATMAVILVRPLIR